MSGWDEGGLYYSDQEQFPHGGGDRRHRQPPPSAPEIQGIQKKFKPNVFPYREALLSNPTFLLADLANLISHDPDQILPQFLQQNPADYLPLFENAAAEVPAGLRARVQGETGEMEEPMPGEVQVLLRSEQDPVSMRSLGVS